MPPELRTISLPPPPSLPITRHYLHPAPLSVTPWAFHSTLNVISSNTPPLTHLIIHPLHLNDTHLNSYSVSSWYSGNRPWAALDPTFGNPPLIRRSARE